MKINSGEYFTVQEMSSILGESTNTIKKRILRLGIKAIVRDALYSSIDFEKIRNTPSKGRPKQLPEKKEPVKRTPKKRKNSRGAKTWADLNSYL